MVVWIKTSNVTWNERKSSSSSSTANIEPIRNKKYIYIQIDIYENNTKDRIRAKINAAALKDIDFFDGTDNQTGNERIEFQFNLQILA
jgi:hypothetical protein